MGITMPRIRTYGDYKSDNYGAHSLQVTFGSLTVYFSYDTPVAFQTPGRRVVRQNEWKTTTGKHLNWIDGGDKKGRVSGDQFEAALAAELASREPMELEGHGNAEDLQG